MDSGTLRETFAICSLSESHSVEYGKAQGDYEVWPSKKIEHKRMRLEVENNSQEVKIGYFENAGSVFAGFPCVHGMSGRVTSIVGWN
jgi:hypothetical protein